MKHTITAATPSNVLFGAGVYYFNLTWDSAEKKWNGIPFGATNGGGKLIVKGDFVDLDLDGALVKFKGQTVKLGGAASMEISLAELTESNVKILTLFERGNSGVAGYDLLSDKPFIAFGDYLENVAFVGKTADGTQNIIVIFESALCTSGLELDPQNKEQGIMKATVEAYTKNIGDLDTLPVKIYYGGENITPVIPEAALYLYGTPSPVVVTYNGVELPDIESVWTDKETYPYAYIGIQPTAVIHAYVHLTDAPLFCASGAVQIPAGCKMHVYKKYNYNDYWEHSYEKTFDKDTSYGNLGAWLWSSIDILNEDGTTALAASEPVYTYTGGNIGLRNGDSVTMYKGAVLPNIDTLYTDELKETHPYAGIFAAFSDWHILRLLPKDAYYTTFTDGSYSLYGKPIEDWRSIKGDYWEENGSIVEGSGGYISARETTLWVNFDLMNEDGSVYLAKSAPIPVSGIVGYKYGAYVLPDINEVYTDELKETHPYAYVCHGSFHTDINYMVVSSAPKTALSYNGISVNDSDITFILRNGEWEASSISGVNVDWTNTDLYWDDSLLNGGTLCLAASDPIPVYE